MPKLKKHLTFSLTPIAILAIVEQFMSFSFDQVLYIAMFYITYLICINLEIELWCNQNAEK